LLGAPQRPGLVRRGRRPRCAGAGRRRHGAAVGLERSRAGAPGRRLPRYPRTQHERADRACGERMSIADTLAPLLPAGLVETAPAALDARRHDYWAASHVRDFAGTPAPRPGALVRPRSAADVQAVLRVANAQRIPVIPFGLGSGVVGGVI